MNELRVGSDFVAVAAPDQREVVDDLPDVLLEIEAGISRCEVGASEPRDPGDKDIGPRARQIAQPPALMAIRELHAQLVQLGDTERRDELPRGRIHCIEEIRGDFRRVESARNVVR